MTVFSSLQQNVQSTKRFLAMANPMSNITSENVENSNQESPVPAPRMAKEDAVKILRTCQAVFFDVDSTVIPEEGIDELAAFKGVGEIVAEWTKK